MIRLAAKLEDSMSPVCVAGGTRASQLQPAAPEWRARQRLHLPQRRAAAQGAPAAPACMRAPAWAAPRS